MVYPLKCSFLNSYNSNSFDYNYLERRNQEQNINFRKKDFDGKKAILHVPGIFQMEQKQEETNMYTLLNLGLVILLNEAQDKGRI